jgi:hypothetical protein
MASEARGLWRVTESGTVNPIASDQEKPERRVGNSEPDTEMQDAGNQRQRSVVRMQGDSERSGESESRIRD